MRNKKQLIIDKEFNNDIKWLSNTPLYSLKNFIRNEKLEEKLIIFLWNRINLRWELTHYQELPESIIDSIFINKIEGYQQSTAVFLETIKNQNLDKYIKFLNDDLEPSFYFQIWSFRYTELLERNLFNDLLYFFYNSANQKQINRVEGLHIFIEIIRKHPEYLNIFLDSILSSSLYSFKIATCEILAKNFYLNDEILDKIEKKFKKEHLRDMIKHLISKNNCSVNKKAEYLLLGF